MRSTPNPNPPSCRDVTRDREAPDPLSPKASEARRRDLRVYERVATAKESAIRRAFGKLYAQGVIDTPLKDIPRRAPEGIDNYAAALPDDVRSLLESGRLILVEQDGANAPSGVHNRGWVVLDPPAGDYMMPETEGALAGWVIHDHST